MPQKLITEDSEKNNIFLIKEKGKDNLYPYYSDYDLRFLKGKATIYFNTALDAPVIELINCPELKTNFDERLKDLFALKKTWRLEELILFFEGIGLGTKMLEEKILRKVNKIQENSIFDENIKFDVVYLKNKIKK